jgi:hypothetical protein
MKNQIFKKLLLAMSAIMASMFFAPNLFAQNYPAGTNRPNVAPAASAKQTVPQLSYGVPEVLQLARAKISDRTIIAYIRNSGTVYRLNASQIVYLKQQGLSEAVIAAMINQRSRSAAAMQNTAPPTGANADSNQTATVVAPPATTYVQTVPSSTVYVVPGTQSYYYSPYYYSPYYYPYYGYDWWPFPAISFSFGYGGGRWGGYHGGYHHGFGGGYHGGGGYHR